MIHWQDGASDAMRGLRRALDRFDYDLMQRALRGLFYSHDPLPDDGAYHFYHETMPLRDEARALYRLFLFGLCAPWADVRRAMGDTLCDELIELGLLRRDAGNVSADQYLIVSLDGQYYITTRPDLRRADAGRGLSVYIGQDSFRLVHQLDRTRRGIRGLDLCSGSGIAGQAMALYARQVVAVEVSEQAVHVSRANAVLNDLSGSWEVRQGDLWEPVREERFDLIVCNPPYIAVPLPVQFPVYGAGGEDGLLFVRRVLEAAPEHLNADGRLRMVFEGVGSADEALVEPLLAVYAAEHPSCSIKLVLYDRILLSEATLERFGVAAGVMNGAGGGQQAEEITRLAAAEYRRRGYSYMYQVLLIVDRSPAPEETGLRVDRVYNPWDASKVPSLRWAVSFRENPHHIMTSDKGFSLAVNDLQRRLISRFDGRTSVEEAVSSVWSELGGSDSGLTQEQILDSALDICRVMHQLDFVEKPAGLWDRISDSYNPYGSQVRKL